MAQLIFNEEWIVAEKLTEKTGLDARQMKAYRSNSWVEGVHFKRVPAKPGGEIKRALIWYNYPQINRFIQEA
ncbi:excisionase family protein [Lelliottia wanjuensis]|uniref:excisionase family protein n=1 Tax=Lelliottia wanjuensis TaxID=3050585 RepID=UPI00254C2789|nr:excisionase family protein [Lelliottia sp. V104_15]MDK9606633.1 excisionase family protein [Lelliottia sp. V104_15]